MELLTPSIGLIFWQTVIFLSLVFLLKKFAWKPILEALKIREESIEEALQAAERARDEIEGLKADNEKLLDEARHERERILKEARKTASELVEKAESEGIRVSEKIIADARASIQSEKEAAMAGVRNLVAELSLEISEKALRKQLDDQTIQKKLIQEYLKDVKIN